jgi:branched-chain amino acid aminotransferase
MYRDGVNTELFKAIRINPNAKIAHSDARDAIGRFLRSRKLYEVLLVNNEDRLTEGSKSNVFFIKGQEIVTPPGEQVLKGITRSKVIDLCHQFTFTFTERIISMNQLSEFDAAFLTGTSPKILPVRRIGTITYKPDHPIINSLSCAYDALVSAYIQDQLKAF